MHVLALEDDPDQLELLTITLESLGHSVTPSTSAEEALALASSVPFDVAIVDWMMEGLDGLSFCRAIRAMPFDRYRYLMVLASRSGRRALLEALDAGADDFMSKPLDRDVLGARLRVVERILGLRRRVQDLESKSEND